MSESRMELIKLAAKRMMTEKRTAKVALLRDIKELDRRQKEEIAAGLQRFYSLADCEA